MCFNDTSVRIVFFKIPFTTGYEKLLEMSSKCRDVTVFTDFEKVPFNSTKTYGKIRYISPFILHPALDGGEWSTSHPGRFTPMEGYRCPISKRKDGCGAGLDFWRREKLFLLPGFEPRSLHPSHCTD